MHSLKKEAIFAERLRRHRLIGPVRTLEEYTSLFRLLQPVIPVTNSLPCDPPSLVHRTVLDERAILDEWRRNRRIAKGRFMNGRIGYVFSDDLDIYANAFHRPLDALNQDQKLVLDTLKHVGPLSSKQLREETGLPYKRVMPILHRMQQAFLVCEDQTDSNWERPWCLFSHLYPGVVVEPSRWESTARLVLGDFIRPHFFINGEDVKDWSGWSVKNIKQLLNLMQADGEIEDCMVDDLGEGWTGADDAILDADAPVPTAFMLHRHDSLVQAAFSELRSKFAGLEVLQYLLIDGDFRGAVCGHWRIGPHDVEDIVVDLSPAERVARKEEIVQSVFWEYHPPRHRILRYAGEPLVT